MKNNNDFMGMNEKDYIWLKDYFQSCKRNKIKPSKELVRQYLKNIEKQERQFHKKILRDFLEVSDFIINSIEYTI